MVKQGFFKNKGKRSFTRPAHKNSFCRKISCCSSIPDGWDLLLQFEAGSSGMGGAYVFHCAKIGMIVDPANPRRWTGQMNQVFDCIHGIGGGPIDIEFLCDDKSPADPKSCKQVFTMSIEGIPIDEDNCCCFDTNPNPMTGEDMGVFCIVGGLGSVWSDARDGLGLGCNCAEWLEADAEDWSIPIVWGWEEDEYGETCCEPSPCPDDCCPSHPVCGAMAAMMSDVDYEIPEDLAWLRELSELEPS